MGILVAILVLSVLIFFHELGHFTAARFFGVQVDVFSIGFGKKLYSKMIGKTLWSISAIPLGGYVKIKSSSCRLEFRVYSLQPCRYRRQQPANP